MKTSRIGSVSIIETGDDYAVEYSDGEIEDRLLKHFKGGGSAEDFLRKDISWASIYHCSPIRENLLNWFDFKKNSSVLEVGAGCGAITQLLVKKAEAVTAIEISKKRAEVNAYRNKGASNLSVVIGNLENLDKITSVKFDYIVCVGVLEYAGKFIKGSEPYKSFLEKLRSYLKPSGTLLLAIENKLGLKYWAGAQEDHLAHYFAGVEDYPKDSGIRTFSKTELTSLLGASGYENTDFYYPLPDYKLPTVLYSDGYLPGIHVGSVPYSLYPTPVYAFDRQHIIREQLAIRTLSKAGLFNEFANSFLVIASPKKNHFSEKYLYLRPSANRRSEYRTITSIVHNKEGFAITKRALAPEAISHIEKMKKLDKYIAQHNKKYGTKKINEIENSNSVGEINFKYENGQLLSDLLIDALIADNRSEFMKLFDEYVELLSTFDQKTPSSANKKMLSKTLRYSGTDNTKYVFGNYDINFDNVIFSDSIYTLIDLEWVFPFALPKDLLIGRALLYFFRRHVQLIRSATSGLNPSLEIAPNVAVPRWIYVELKDYTKLFRRVVKIEEQFQILVSENPEPKLKFYPKPLLYDHDLSDNFVESYEKLVIDKKLSDDHISNLESVIDILRSDTTKLQKVLGRINKSKVYRLTRKLSDLSRR